MKRQTNMGTSVRQRLLNLSRKRREEFQLVMTRYAIERLLYRLGISPYRHRFVLKGAMLFALWTGVPHRSTRDLDLLGFGDNDITALEEMFRTVCSLDAPNDGMSYRPQTVHGERIRDAMEYQGVRLRMDAEIVRACIPVRIDIGFGDAVTPNPEEVVYPTLLPFPPPMLMAYSKDTFVAEKYQAIVSLGIANS